MNSKLTLIASLVVEAFSNVESDNIATQSIRAISSSVNISVNKDGVDFMYQDFAEDKEFNFSLRDHNNSVMVIADQHDEDDVKTTRVAIFDTATDALQFAIFGCANQTLDIPDHLNVLWTDIKDDDMDEDIETKFGVPDNVDPVPAESQSENKNDFDVPETKPDSHTFDICPQDPFGSFVEQAKQRAIGDENDMQGKKKSLASIWFSKARQHPALPTLLVKLKIDPTRSDSEIVAALEELEESRVVRLYDEVLPIDEYAECVDWGTHFDLMTDLLTHFKLEDQRKSSFTKAKDFLTSWKKKS